MATQVQFGKKKFLLAIKDIRDEMSLMNLLHERLLVKPIIVTEHDLAVAKLSTALFRIEQHLRTIEAMARREPDEERTE